jgi:hypothetical protein
MEKWIMSDSLLENKRHFSKVLCDKHDEGILIISDVITLSPEETKTLCLQLNRINSSEEFQRFCICVIISWVQSYRNGMNDFFKIHLASRYARIPQHARGVYFKIYENTFLEYGLDTFGREIKTLDDIEFLVRKHSGVEDTSNMGLYFGY